MDFFKVSTRSPKRDVLEILPVFEIVKSSDLMIRGGDFYAIWDADRKMWSLEEQDAIRLIDQEVDKYYNDNLDKFHGDVRILHMRDASSGVIDKWHKYCQKQMRDNYHMLDEKLIFSNTETTKRDYASKRLPYPLEKGPCESWDKLMSVIYSPEERAKIEWAIGSVIAGDSKHIQKFLVFYGSAGTGKSTVLNVIQQLFDGYYSVFDARALGSSSNSFALESFKSNPLVAIQHDGDLSRIEDNTRLNSLVSHELMTVNEKFKSAYTNKFNALLFMGTNKPVKITDARSGLMRRLIDVSPTGKKVPPQEYKQLMKGISFELGCIAQHCLDIYNEDPDKYEDYLPLEMMGASNDFFNYILESYHVFNRDDGVTLKAAWEMYKTYCSEANVPYPYSQRIFKEELKNYFWHYDERYTCEDGTRLRSYFYGFKNETVERQPTVNLPSLPKINLRKRKSIFDEKYADTQAQYANKEDKPLLAWSKVKSKLSDIDTSEVHYVRVPENHIVIDFDIKNESGEKDFEMNLDAASKWPPTYAEVSKGGNGIHLHYIYLGDTSLLSREYAKDIEIKIFTGKSSLRRKLTKCNDLPIASISSGLPLKGERKNVVSTDVIKTEKGLRAMIEKNLNREVHKNTAPSISFIFKILQDAYDSGLKYDVSDMKSAVIDMALSSTNQSDICMKQVSQMKFKSDEASEFVPSESDEIAFYDVEVFPNLFLVNWKLAGEGKPIVRLINPKPTDIENLMKYRLIGFNNRRYDNHILYGCLNGYSNMELFNLSQNIIEKKRGFFSEAYNVSYTDIYDYCAKKQSLKKWEIELGISHVELGLPWNEPVDEKLWPKVAEYCDYDVLATEAVWNHTQGDFKAREILAKLSGLSVNDTTNSHTTRIIFGSNRRPQNEFNYRFMGGPEPEDDIYEKFDEKGRPIFPGYVFDKNKSYYREFNPDNPDPEYREVGEGGVVYAEPGMWGDVALLDVKSMHPSSIVAEQLFGPQYTPIFADILHARLAIKEKRFDDAKKMLGGRLAEFLDDESLSKDLAQALKIAINSVYGLTAATFDHPFRDKRNLDNIVAKRGALFMINLKHAVEEQGYKVVHIKTDSIKIPNATPEIIDFVMKYGEKYGYEFDHEATYKKMCLVNKAVYIAQYDDGKWTATGTQFAVPYVFKKLFTHEPIIFKDLCETKSVTSSIYLDMNEGYPDVTAEEKELQKAEQQYRKGELSDTTFNDICKDLNEKIAKGHNYIFVGKVGSFCPVVDGARGGLLMRLTNEGKYAAVTGTKGYRWIESEILDRRNSENERAFDFDIDYKYYNDLTDEAWKTLVAYGDVDIFLSDDPLPKPEFVDGKPVYEEELPWA